MTKKIPDFATLTSADSNDIVAGFDVSANVEKKIPVSGLPAGFPSKSIDISKLNGGSAGIAQSDADGDVAIVTASDFSSTWSTWSPTLTGFSANPANGVYRYRRIGKDVTLQIRQPTNGTSNSATFTISLPFTAATITNMEWHAPCQVTNGSTQTTPGLMYIGTGGTAIEVYLNYGAAGFATTGNKRMGYGQITYEVA